MHPQSLLWMEPDHPIIIGRLAGIFLCGLPAVRELYQYINDPRFVVHHADANAAQLTAVNLNHQESGQDGAAYMALTSNHLHRAPGD